MIQTETTGNKWEELGFLLTGLAKSGKTTIDKIIVDTEDAKGQPLFMKQQYSRLSKNGRVLRMKVIDLPDTNVILEPTSPAPFDKTLFEDCAAIIFVIDLTDDYVNALSKLCALAVRNSVAHSRIPFEVLLHKAESLEEVDRLDVLKDISQKAREEIEELCDNPPTVNFYLTTIFDSSLSLTLSRIIQKHIPEFMAMEALLDMFCNNSKIEKAYIFDTVRKLFVASDSSPFGMRSFELTSETLDMITDLKSIYGTSSLKVIPSGSLRLSSGITVGYSGINEYLSFLYLYNGDTFPGKTQDIFHNVTVARSALMELLSSDTFN